MYYKVADVGTDRVVVVQSGKQYRVHPIVNLTKTLQVLMDTAIVPFDKEHAELIKAILRDLPSDEAVKDSHYFA